jgi:hypothetical protein
MRYLAAYMRDKCAASHKIVTAKFPELRTVHTESAARAKVLTVENLGAEDLDLMNRKDALVEALLGQLRGGCAAFLRGVKAKSPSFDSTSKQAAASFPEAGAIADLHAWIQEWYPGNCIWDEHIEKLLKAFENAPTFKGAHCWTTTSKEGKRVVSRQYKKSKPGAVVLNP